MIEGLEGKEKFWRIRNLGVFYFMGKDMMGILF